jgi:hypothetical protein
MGGVLLLRLHNWRLDQGLIFTAKNAGIAKEREDFDEN